MSLINTKIKPFKNQAFKNGEFIEVTEKDTEGRWSVFFFYPADFTFVCPTELGDVADHYEELQKLGVDVYSVSTDTHFTHKAWHSSSETIAKIKYAMIGDPTGALTTQAKFARLNGKKVKRLWLRLWTWSAKSKFPSPFTQLLRWRRLLTPVTY